MDILNDNNILTATVAFIEGLGVTIPSLVELVRAGTWVIGIILMFSAIMRLRKFKQPNGERELNAAMWQMLFATLAINLDTALGSATASMFGSSDGPMSPLSYPTNPSDGWFSGRMSMVMMIILIWVQFVGYLAFVRGILILNKNATVHPTPVGISFAKGMTHIVGAVIACNLSLFVDYLR